MTVLAAAALVAAVYVLAVGFLAYLFDHAARIDRRTAANRRVARIAADRETYRNLPPGVTAGEVYSLQHRRGISAEEAARLLFTTRARIRLRAVIERDLARRRPGPGPLT